MQETIQEESPSADDTMDEPVMKPPKTPEEVKEDKEKSEVQNDDEKVPDELEKVPEQMPETVPEKVPEDVPEEVPETVPEQETEKVEPMKKEVTRVTRRMTRSRNNSQENKTAPEVEVIPVLNTITEDKSENQSEMEVEESGLKKDEINEVQQEEMAEDKQEEELNSEVEMIQSTGRKVSVQLDRVKTPSKTRRGRSRQNSEEKEILKTVTPLNLEAISEEKVAEEVKETEEKVDEKKTRRGGRTKKGIEIDLEKAKPARKTASKKSKKKSEILELDFDPVQMLDEVDSKEGKISCHTFNHKLWSHII